MASSGQVEQLESGRVTKDQLDANFSDLFLPFILINLTAYFCITNSLKLNKFLSIRIFCLHLEVKLDQIVKN